MQRLQLTHDRRLATQGEVRFNARFQRREPRFLQTNYLDLGEGLVDEVCQGHTTPQRQGVLEQSCPSGELAGLDCGHAVRR